MAVITLMTEIAAPRAALFDLARDVGFHERSMAAYGERAVGGKTAGLLGPGDEVTWRALHFGLTLELTVRIVSFEPPRYFRDALVRGPFTHMTHDHEFEERGARTVMIDVFEYLLPLGLLGVLVDRLFVRRRLRRILEARARAIAAAGVGQGHLTS